MKLSPRMAVLAIVSTLLWLALAAFATGGIGVFLARPQFVALALITLAFVVAALATEAGIRTGVREDRGNRWVLVVFTALGLLHGFLPPYTDRIGFWTLDGDAIRWIGVVLYAVGGVLRLWPVFVLGRRFSGLLTALVLVPLVARMNSEEALLASEFGATYDAYKARTWRLIPYIY
jgi:protein-S-isoprenylcysteine O-methyltransferase Ste14